MKGTFEPDGPLREHVNGISYRPTPVLSATAASKQTSKLAICWTAYSLCCCSETCANSTNLTLTDILQRIENLCTTPHWDMVDNCKTDFLGHKQLSIIATFRR